MIPLKIKSSIIQWTVDCAEDFVPNTKANKILPPLQSYVMLKIQLQSEYNNTSGSYDVDLV